MARKAIRGETRGNRQRSRRTARSTGAAQALEPFSCPSFRAGALSPAAPAAGAAGRSGPRGRRAGSSGRRRRVRRVPRGTPGPIATVNTRPPPAAPQQPASPLPSSKVTTRTPCGPSCRGDPRDELRQAQVGGGEVAVVGRVAEAGADPGEGGQRVAFQVRVELARGHDVGATGRVGGDRGEVHERVVPLHVAAGPLAPEAGVRHSFHVGAPADAGARELIGEVGPAGDALGAVGVDAEGRAAEQRQVVGQGGMGYRVVAGGEGAALASRFRKGASGLPATSPYPWFSSTITTSGSGASPGARRHSLLAEAQAGQEDEQDRKRPASDRHPPRIG